MSNDYDFLKDNNAFEPPEPEYRLRQQSEKLVFSTRLFPAWVTAAFAIFKKKYPDTPIDNSSKLLQLLIQDYIKQNYQLVGERLPPTEDAIDMLITRGFVNPKSNSQFRKLSKASQKATEYEAEATSSGRLYDQWEYWKNRDPEKADQIWEEMQEDLIAGLEGEESQEPKETQKNRQDSSEETVVSDNRSGYEQQEGSSDNKEEIATLDYLDDIEAEEED